MTSVFSALSALDVNIYIKDSDGIWIEDGKFTLINIKKDGSYFYYLSDNGNTGYVSKGSWKQNDEIIEMTGSWATANSLGSNKVKIFKMKIDNMTPVANRANVFNAFYHFEEISYK
jgi:hypothetical protein